MRGEDANPVWQCTAQYGSPPHARGRPASDEWDNVDVRLTPACAGKTSLKTAAFTGLSAHPRMRGEDLARGVEARRSSGSPPHARGRLRPRQRRMALDRLTPACAGKTPGTNTAPPANPAHPRMRGEDHQSFLNVVAARGSPPHARGRLEPATVRLQSMGAHPRMRGEESPRLLPKTSEHGSPPHARGRPYRHRTRRHRLRLTPACAGKTHSVAPGEEVEEGSPPHARGRLGDELV